MGADDEDGLRARQVRCPPGQLADPERVDGGPDGAQQIDAFDRTAGLMLGADDYLTKPLDATLSGSAVSELQHASLGCNIKWRHGSEPDLAFRVA